MLILNWEHYVYSHPHPLLLETEFPCAETQWGVFHLNAFPHFTKRNQANELEYTVYLSTRAGVSKNATIMLARKYGLDAALKAAEEVLFGNAV